MIKIITLAENTINRVKNMTDCRRVFAVFITKIVRKLSNSVGKWPRYKNRWFTEKELQMAFKHMKRFFIFTNKRYTN